MKLEFKSVDELVTLIQVCAWAFVVFIVMMVFGGTVASMLYSVMFVGQPMKSMSPIDQAFTKMLNDIVLLMAGSISTLVGMFAINKGARTLANKLAPSMPPPNCPAYPQAYSPSAPSSGMPDFNWMGLEPVQFDEDWRAPPPPTTPPDHLDPAREEIAQERAAAARIEE